MDRIFIKRGLDARFGTNSPVTSCIIVNEELPRKYKSIAKLYSSSLHVYCLRLCLGHIMFGNNVCPRKKMRMYSQISKRKKKEEESC